MADTDIVVTIKVTAGNHGLAHFTYDPSTFMCKRDDTIQWKCNQGAFAIHFGERALLGAVAIRSENQTLEGPWSTRPLTIGKKHLPANQNQDDRLPLQPGMYKYSVAVNVAEDHGDLPKGLYIDACPSGGYVC